MLEAIRIVGLDGSVKPSFTSRAALTLALEGAAQSGAETLLLEVARASWQFACRAIAVAEVE